MLYNVVETHVLLLESIPIAESSHANSDTLHLAGVRWTNSTFRGANLHTSTMLFIQTIADLMEIENNMRTIGHIQSTIGHRTLPNLSFTPMFSCFKASISSNKVNIFTTQPFPMMHLAWGWTIPIGTKWKATAFPWIIMVWPALAPPLRTNGIDKLSLTLITPLST